MCGLVMVRVARLGSVLWGVCLGKQGPTMRILILQSEQLKALEEIPKKQLEGRDVSVRVSKVEPEKEVCAACSIPQ